MNIKKNWLYIFSLILNLIYLFLIYELFHAISSIYVGKINISFIGIIIYIIFILIILISFYITFKLSREKISILSCLIQVPVFAIIWLNKFSDYNKYFVNSIGIYKYFLFFIALSILYLSVIVYLVSVIKIKIDIVSNFKKITTSLLLIFLLIFICNVLAKYIHWIHGDEANYLWLTESIIKDRDINLYNNVPKSIHFRIPGAIEYPGNIIYTVHLPGLPILLVPFFYFGGVLGAKFFIMLIYLIFVFYFFKHIDETKLININFIIFIVPLLLSNPFILYCGLIYADSVAMILLFFLMLEILSEKNKISTIGIILYLFLPWLHIKYTFFYGIFWICLIMKYFFKNKIKNISILLILTIINIFALMLFHKSHFNTYIITGGFYKEQQYSGSVFSYFFVKNKFAFSNFLKLFFDGKEGLLFLSPFLFFLPAAFVSAYKKNKFDFITIFLFGIPYIIFIAVNMYTPGYSPYGRFLLPVVLVLIYPFLFLDIKYIKFKITKIFYILFLGYSLFYSYILSLMPLWSYPDFSRKPAFINFISDLLNIPSFNIFPYFNNVDNFYEIFNLQFFICVIIFICLNFFIIKKIIESRSSKL